MGETYRQPSNPGRLDAIDMLRGLVMVVMALDHTRDFFSFAVVDPDNLKSPLLDPTDLEHTTLALFFTRWITHFCAPVFVFLAGTGAFLYGSRGRTRMQLSWFLLSRGAWLVFLELTVIKASWMFNFDIYHHGGGVFWAIGWAMIGLSVLVFLPTSAVGALGVVILAYHNLLDVKTAEDLRLPEWFWGILHSPGRWELGRGYTFETGYCLLPWMGVMAAGYGFGAIWLLEPRVRQKQLLGLGAVMTLTFLGMRASNLYGDASQWTNQSRDGFTILSFLNCTKYPPSLMYALMTLGPAIMALAWFDRGIGIMGRPFVIFGRVPLFYYLLHIPLIHGLAVALDYYRFGKSPLANESCFAFGENRELLPEGYGLPLPYIYLIWIGVVVFLFPVCYWFAGIKKRHRDGWLSYL